MKHEPAQPMKTATHARRVAVDHKPITVRIGLLGLGNVGQAVARLAAASRGQMRRRGIDFIIAGALVRDAARAREFAPAGCQTTDDPEAFFAQQYDLVIEVMGGTHPAYAYLERCLQAGVPIVTANKSLMAARGVELFRTAAECGTSLRCEASAIAGVPFLSALRDRPLIARVKRLSGILNGTSNYILSSMERDGVSFESALRDAQEKGYAEPDPSLDIGSVDAAEKLIVILQHLGITGMRLTNTEVVGIDQLIVADFQQAHAFGGVIKSICMAEIGEDVVKAFVGPAFVAAQHPLATVAYERNGVRLRGPDIGDLVFTGPGAGPDITAATILDDATQIVTQGAGVLPPSVAVAFAEKRVEAPSSPWLIRCLLPATADADQATQQVTAALAKSGVSVRRTGAIVNGGLAVYALTQPRAAQPVSGAADRIRTELGCDVVVLRALDE